MSYLAIHLLNARMSRAIRRTSDILNERSARIRVLIGPQSTELRAIFDRLLGFRYRANCEADGVKINPQGIRSFREYSTNPPGEILRLSAFGDSMVYSGEVGNKDTWAHLIEQENPNLEVLNYGVQISITRGWRLRVGA